MEVIISNTIQIHDAPAHIIQTIKKGLTLPNPLYHKLLRMGKVKALYGVKKEFRYYASDQDTLYIGRGSEERLRGFLDRHVADYSVRERVCRRKLQHPLAGTLVLREYQQGDIEEIAKYHHGVIRLDTGYGKTIISCRLVEEVGLATLIIVPRSHLLSQFAQEFKRWYNCDVGIIQGTERTIKDITIASVQTLVRHPELVKTLVDKFGMLIVDECHGSITDKQLAVIQSFPVERLYGLTATPRRTDQQSDAIFFTFGPVIINKGLERATPIVERLVYPGHIPMSENYHEIIEAQINNEERTGQIVRCVHEEIRNNRRILVLAKRVEHYKDIEKKIKDQYPDVHPIVISSDVNAKERTKIIKSLREGKKNFSIILGTYSMLATGTDIPALDTLIFAGDLKSDVLQEQSAGRILRLFGDKQHPKIIDIVDTGNPILKRQAIARMKFYKLMGWV